MDPVTSILLVEDDPSLSRSLSAFLIAKGYFVIEASDGGEAVDLFRKVQPHLIISDLKMPGIGGLELLETVKAERADTPFIIISGQGTIDDAIEGLRLGAWDYLTKPIHPLGLLGHCVSKTLERARLLKEVLHHQNSLEMLVEQRTTDLEKAFRDKEVLQSQLLQAHKLESVGQLAAGIAHEINTPTQFVSSNVSFLDEAFSDIKALIDRLTYATQGKTLSHTELNEALDEADWPYLTEEIPKAILQSREGLTRVTSIVRAMKEFSHPGSSGPELSDINHLIENTVTVARNEWKYSSEVVLNLAPDLPKIPCMNGPISQVLLNLLVNAAQSISEKLGKTPEGGKGTITITTETVGSSVLIHIADTGCGIPDNFQARIFEPFFTTKEIGKGTGQGLAIAYDVITRKHNGILTFRTIIGEGTIFTIELPTAKRKNHK